MQFNCHTDTVSCSFTLKHVEVMEPVRTVGPEIVFFIQARVESNEWAEVLVVQKRLTVESKQQKKRLINNCLSFFKQQDYACLGTVVL